MPVLAFRKTYAELLKGQKATTIIVGVLDSGVDLIIKTLRGDVDQPGEIPAMVDDDKNGYIDDILMAGIL